jgi:hypothetical protein
LSKIRNAGYFTFVRAFILPVGLLCILFASGIFIALAVGQQQPPSEWFTALRFEMCELPCWVGIIPGQTTMGEAEARVEEAYSNSSLYSVESEIEYGAEELVIRVAYLPTNYRTAVVFTSDTGNLSDQSLVQSIYLVSDFRFYQQARPTIPELITALGIAHQVRISSFEEIPKLGLFFNNGQVAVLVDRLTCDRVLITQRIFSILISDNAIDNGYFWLSQPAPWHGFGQCHNLEPDLFSNAG